MNSLEARGLYKAFGPVQVLAGVDLVVPAGSFTAVLGPSGSGKTTLLRVLAGFERADAGSVVLGGVTVEGEHRHLVPEQRGIGYVPQEAALFPHLTVEANIGFGLHGRSRRRGAGRAGQPPERRSQGAREDHHHHRREVRRKRVGELLDTVGLGGLGRRYPHQLSGGQQQRVALARALAIGPRLVLLDEPFGSLDASMRASVRADVRRTLAEAGTTAILVTHDQDEAMSLADHLAVLRDGRIAQHGTPREVYVRPVDAELAGFLGSANLLDGVVDESGHVVDTILGALPLEQGLPITSGKVSVLLRPEQLLLHSVRAAASGTASPDDTGRPVARVVGYDFHGHDATVRLSIEGTGAGPEVRLVARAAGSPQFEEGGEVTLSAAGPVIVWPGPVSDPGDPR